MTRRLARRWPSPKRTRWRTPRTRRDWLITVAVASAALAVKLTIGAGVVLLLLRHLLR
ncbi:MAG: hypothetical protein ACR2MP_23895 [Streptosporangiaceae bacterium]